MKKRERTLGEIGIKVVALAMAMMIVGWGSIIFFSESVTLIGTLELLGWIGLIALCIVGGIFLIIGIGLLWDHHVNGNTE